MNSNREIYRAATLLMRQYGADAQLRAAKRIGKLTDDGDLDRAKAWWAILAALVELQRSRREGEAVN